MNTSASLTRLVYVSQATFKPFHTPEGMECHVAQILTTSRENNQKNQLFGALYYGQGSFFQCLEGEKSAVDTLYAKLLQDSRHHNLKILDQHPIASLSFQDWEMKYALIDQLARDFVRQHQLRGFDPYQFSTEMVRQFLDLLLDNQDTPTDMLQQAARTPLPASTTDTTSSINKTTWLIVIAIVVVTIIALIVVM